MIRLCIPKIENHINENFIHQVFKKLDVGNINNINIIRSQKGTKKAFINLIEWNKTEKAGYLQHRLKTNSSVNIIYIRPWFWKVKLAH